MSKSSISKASSYKAMGEFWDKHDLSLFWKKTRKVFCKVIIQNEIIYNRKMTCVLCGGKLQKKKVNQEIRLGNDHIMAPVNALVCTNCHETYYPAGL